MQPEDQRVFFYVLEIEERKDGFPISSLKIANIESPKKAEKLKNMLCIPSERITIRWRIFSSRGNLLSRGEI